MGLFSSEYRDAELGTFSKSVFGQWKGRARLLSDMEQELRLPGSSKEPDLAALSILKELPARYDSLQTEIQVHLFEHFEPYREAVEAGEEEGLRGRLLPSIASPLEVWSSTRPVRVILESTKTKRLEIAFEVVWDEEHTLGATVENWRVVNFTGSVAP